MSKEVKLEMTSRRGVLSYLGFMTFSLTAVPALLVSDAEAQTAGMERREERREGRQDRREDRRAGRQERRDERRGVAPAASGTTGAAAPK
jgi:hypothetical protein